MCLHIFFLNTFLNILCNIASQAFTGIQDENADYGKDFCSSGTTKVHFKCLFQRNWLSKTLHRLKSSTRGMTLTSSVTSWARRPQPSSGSLKRPESSLRLMVQYHNQISFSHFLLSPLCHALISVLHIFSHTFLPYFLSKSSLLSVSKLSSTVTMKT